MIGKTTKWEFLSRKKPNSPKEIVDILLENRGLKTKIEFDGFFEPKHPLKLSLKELDISEKEIKKAVARVKKAVDGNEKIIVYGDYDADGVCASAILWECLYLYTKNVIPYLPDRFSEGYGINVKSVEKIKKENPDLGLIITVDNGVVANSAVEKASELGIDVVISDHHQKGEKYPDAYSVIHTDLISGSGVAWVFAREIGKRIKKHEVSGVMREIGGKDSGLELAAIGTIADQLPLIGANRSIAKYGLEELNKTSRLGLLVLFEEAGIGKITSPATARPLVGTYEVNYLIAPRINAMGRLKSAMVSLRLLCTNNKVKAKEYAYELGRTNKDRQQIVDQVILHARETASRREWKGAIVLSDTNYHEGVIGLAAGKLAEEFGRPAIVLSKGAEVSKASARSISGFNIIENIRKMESLIIGGGGHPMAAGFSIETSKIEEFTAEFEKLTEPLLTEEVLQKKIKIDCEISFSEISQNLYTEIKKFEPTGMGNFAPVFSTVEVEILDARGVGAESKHLKLKLSKDGVVMDAIAFNLGYMIPKLIGAKRVDIAFNLDENTWNGVRSLQLKIKDIHLH